MVCPYTGALARAGLAPAGLWQALNPLYSHGGVSKHEHKDQGWSWISSGCPRFSLGQKFFAAPPPQGFSGTCLANDCSADTKKSPLNLKPGQHVHWKNDITLSHNLEFLLWGSLTGWGHVRGDQKAAQENESGAHRGKNTLTCRLGN